MPYGARNVDATTFSIMFDYLHEELSKYGNVLDEQKILTDEQDKRIMIMIPISKEFQIGIKLKTFFFKC